MSAPKKAKTWRMPRRTLLAGAGTALFLPLLEQMQWKSARAAGSDPRRFLVLYRPNGVYVPAYLPSETGVAYALPPTLQPLAAFRDQMVVVSGLQNSVVQGLNLHIAGICGWLTGGSPVPGKNGVSMDQLLANAWAGATPFQSLQLGTDSSSAWYKTGEANCDSNLPCNWGLTLSWRDDHTPVPIEMNPKAAFDRLFGGLPASGSGATETPDAVARRASLGSVLDAVRAQTLGLQGRLGPTDRRRLEEYLTAVREVEVRLTAPPVSGAAACGAAPSPADGLAWPSRLKAMLDITALTLQCDLTRVITLMMAEAESGEEFRFLGLTTPTDGQQKGHHGASHWSEDPTTLVEPLKRIESWYSEQVAYLASKLKAVQETAGTLLENSLVLYGSEMGSGDDHSYREMPVTLLGGAPVGLPSGRHIRFENEPPIANLHVTLMQSLGVPVGSLGNSTGPISLSG